jgi:hypothetical protein
MSRNKMYDEILTNLKNEFATVDFATYGLSDNEKIYKNICDLLDRMQAVYEAKDSDYSENDLPMGNLLESQELGIEPWKGVLLRIGDKKRRVGSFVKKEKFLVKDEAVDDTLVDMANYSMLGCVLWCQKYSSSRMDHKVHNHWISLASYCIITKILFENRMEEKSSPWATTGWENVLIHYNNLANFARNN